MAVSISISITQNSQSIANNKSNVTVKLTASWTQGSHNGVVDASGTPQAKGWVKINGTTYDFASTFNYPPTDSGSKTIFTKTLDISHNNDGTKTLSCSASYATGISSGTVTASASKVLTTIPRKSSLSASNGTLGIQQTLTVTKQATSFTHTITYKCGSLSGTVCTKSSSTSVSWTPPISLASQNTTGKTVSVTFTITTYNGDTNVGSNTKTITCTIPSSVKPSCSITVTDPTGHMDKYGGFIKGISKFKVAVSATSAYGSAISSYQVTANGSTYTSASFTTGVLKSHGTLTVSAKITDKRGHTSDTASVSKTVLDYTAPTISSIAANRCNEDGSENNQGEYVKVVFSSVVTSLSNKNSATFKLEYKAAAASSYTPLESGSLSYSTAGRTAIFKADTGSSYDIRLTVSDNFTHATKTTAAPTGFTLMHWLSNGMGMAIGKISEISGVLDIGLKTRFYGGILHPVLAAKTDLNDVRTPNTYIGADTKNYSYVNCPISSGTFTLIVEGCGEAGQVRQTFIGCSKHLPKRFVRFYYQSSWGSWMNGTVDQTVLYENASGSDGTITLAYGAENFTYLEIYYTDNNGKGMGYTKIWNPNGKAAHLQLQEAASTVYYRQTAYSISGAKMTPELTTASYVRITSAGAVSTSFGTNYIKIVRVIGLA